SSGAVRKSLLQEAQSLYTEAANIGLRHEEFSNDELHDLIMEIIYLSYRLSSYDSGQRAYEVLADYAAEDGNTLLQAEMLVQLADWELFYSRHLGTVVRDSALAKYQEAYRLLSGEQVSAAAIEALFSPATPVVLPSFVRTSLVPAGAESAHYIDVSFVIARNGEGDGIEIVGSSDDVGRAEIRDLVQAIKRNRFRPRVARDGELDMTPVTVRYEVVPR
ncbi:MAG: hypothetical protein R3305_07845, partial [Gammaproteobacteria bacterium]|nr:hypothetical protein [Gammaproteobacteria bacterium]